VPKAQGFDEILIPGEPEARLEAQHRKAGIPYSPHDSRRSTTKRRRPACSGCRSPIVPRIKVPHASRRLRHRHRRAGISRQDRVPRRLGWSTVVLIRGRGKVAMIDTGNFNVRSC
jgi:hypothetical protein